MPGRGRPTKPYRPSFGGDVPGLTRKADGRWEIRSKGIRFTEPDEHKAVTKATDILGLTELENAGRIEVRLQDGGRAEITVDPSLRVDQWAWLREQFEKRHEWVCEQVGLRLQVGDAPDLSITRVLKTYREHGGAEDKAKQEATQPLERLVAHAGASTLGDLTTSRLLAWKAHIEKAVPGPASRRAYYSRVRTVVAFGLKAELPNEPIRDFLDRAKVLWTAEAMPALKPTPISREDFYKLLKQGGEKWRVWLLVGLNLCLHLGEVCQLQWADFDLEKGTYAAIRNKTKRQRIPRCRHALAGDDRGVEDRPADQSYGRVHFNTRRHLQPQHERE